MANFQKTVSEPDALSAMAKDIIGRYANYRVFIFNGQLGAGKTTFIKEICVSLGVSDTMSSPTFGLINEYITNNGTSIFHLDCYRLEDEHEAWDIGLEEILDGQNYCFVEWPDKILNLLPEKYVRVDIVLEGGARTFNFTAIS